MTLIAAGRVIVVLLLATLSPLIVRPQQNKTSPDERPRNIKSESKKAYVDWVKDVEPILTDEDRSAWEKLKTNDEREQFIQLFWRQRDPDPDTEENEFKEQYYERVAYANAHYSSGKPGRLTDRGRIYIKFGAPDEIESHPTGGSYDRPSYEGFGSTTTYPFEKWFYRYIANVGSGIELEFVDPTGSGEYRLASSPDEKDIALHAGGSVGRADYTRAPDSPLAMLSRRADLDRVQPIDRQWIGSIIDTPKVDENPIAFETQLNYFRQSDNSVLTALTIQVENSELVFDDVGGLQTARLNILGFITSVTDKRLGKFEDPVITHATPEELSSVRTRKSAYAKTFVLQPGRYRIDLVVRDVSSGATGIQHIGFQVPSFPVDRLAASSIVLAAKLEKPDNTVAAGPFFIGTTKVIPNISASYTQGQPVGIYLQVYNAAIDQTTLRPAVDVDYVLLKDGKELARYREDWREINDAGQRLTLTRLLDTRSLATGEYQIQVDLRDQITGQKLSPTAKFSIVSQPER